MDAWSHPKGRTRISGPKCEAHRPSGCFFPGVPTHGSEHPLPAFFLADSRECCSGQPRCQARICPHFPGGTCLSFSPARSPYGSLLH